jgi:peroxiredoxin
MAVISTMLPLGTKAPEFTLPDVVSDRELSLDQLASERATLVMFLCVHCPYVKHVNAELVRLANDYTPRGVAFVAISSNDVERYPQDSPENMRRTAEELGYPFPYLYDESQEVARAYQAACTPDFYLFDGERRLVYRGQLDDSRPSTDTPVTGHDVRAALDALLDGRDVPTEQIASIGCGIKWKDSIAM